MLRVSTGTCSVGFGGALVRFPAVGAAVTACVDTFGAASVTRLVVASCGPTTAPNVLCALPDAEAAGPVSKLQPIKAMLAATSRATILNFVDFKLRSCWCF